MKNFFTKKLSFLPLTALLLIGSAVQANGTEDNPCDSKIVVECGVEYTAELFPGEGSWVNYTEVPHSYTGSEQVFEFTAPSSGLYIVELDQGQADADFFIMDACSNTAGNVTGFYWTGEHEEYVNLEEGVTYYIIADLYQNASQATTVSIKIDCPDEVVIAEPDFDCFQGDGIPSTINDGYNLDPLNADTKIADDFIVEEGTQFTLRHIAMDTNQIQSPDHAVFNIREDNAGKPGEIVETFELAPSSSVAYAAMYDEPVYHMTFDLEEGLTFTEGTYWLEVKMTTPQPSTVWWVSTINGSNGSSPMISEDNGMTWEADEGYQAVFFVAGDCEDSLGVNDLASFDFNYYPNPVNDVLNIQSQNTVKSIEIFNLTGQKVMNPSKVNEGEVNMTGLNSGVYIFKVTLENGVVETFKVVKK